MGPTAKFAKHRGKASPIDLKTGTLERNMEKALEFGIRACEGNIPQVQVKIRGIFILSI
jgi:hypothetical protein